MNINFLSIKQVREVVENYTVKELNSPEVVHQSLEQLFQLSEKAEEHFVMLSLDSKNKVNGAHLLSIGGLNYAMVHPREVFQHALLNNASAIILAHNHPSGNTSPSKEDLEVTKRLMSAGQLMGIKVLDHLIIADGRYKSLRQDGLIENWS